MSAGNDTNKPDGVYFERLFNMAGAAAAAATIGVDPETGLVLGFFGDAALLAPVNLNVPG
jgi:hypothetical protein